MVAATLLTVAKLRPKVRVVSGDPAEDQQGLQWYL